MAVKSSGTLSFDTDIVGEFKGTKPHSLSEYYAGGAQVPAGTKNASGTAIPSSGTIKFSDFYGAAASKAPTIDPSVPASDYELYDNATHHFMKIKKTMNITFGSAVTYDVLLVGGGGGGGTNTGGGGGAGRYVQQDSMVIPAGTHTVTIGAGGDGGTYRPSVSPQSGGSTVFNGVTAVGGGPGASQEVHHSQDGGSGGGGGGRYGGDRKIGHQTGGIGFGHDGAMGDSEDQGGGGGGAGAPGQLPNGGDGKQWYDGNWYAGGGAGGRGSGVGGKGGGGNAGPGDSNTSYATPGTPNTGGGGGGKGGGGNADINTARATSKGGSGVVIFRWPK